MLIRTLDSAWLGLEKPIDSDEIPQASNHKSVLLGADWEGAAAEVWEKGGTASGRDWWTGSGIHLEQEPGIAGRRLRGDRT